MDVSPVVELCVLLLPTDSFGGLADLAGASNSPNAAASAAGGAGAGAAAGAGGPPGGQGSSEGGGDNGDGDGPPTKRSILERLFGSEKATQDVGISVAQDLAMGIPLDIASKTLPGATGVVGALGTAVSASQVLADGIRAVNSSGGRGLGGGSNAAKEGMREAFRRPDGTYRGSDSKSSSD